MQSRAAPQVYSLSNRNRISSSTLHYRILFILSAEERNEIYKGADMKVYLTNGKPDLLIQTIE
jgi:hypothetical protein